MRNSKLLKWIVAAIVFAAILFAIVFYKPVTFRDVKYERNNYVLNRTDVEYYEDIVHIGLNELGIENTYVNIIKAEPHQTDPDLEIQAAIRYNGSQYLIIIYNVMKFEAVEILAHELIHLKQYHTGELVDNGVVVIHKGAVYTRESMPPYPYRTWEIEAFTEQKELKDKIEEIMLY